VGPARGAAPASALALGGVEGPEASPLSGPVTGEEDLSASQARQREAVEGVGGQEDVLAPSQRQYMTAHQHEAALRSRFLSRQLRNMDLLADYVRGGSTGPNRRSRWGLSQPPGVHDLL